jgi:hypothetical protein
VYTFTARRYSLYSCFVTVIRSSTLNLTYRWYSSGHACNKPHNRHEMCCVQDRKRSRGGT